MSLIPFAWIDGDGNAALSPCSTNVIENGVADLSLSILVDPDRASRTCLYCAAGGHDDGDAFGGGGSDRLHPRLCNYDPRDACAVFAYLSTFFRASVFYCDPVARRTI